MKMAVSYFGIIIIAAIALLVIAVAVVLIVALTSRKKDGEDIVGVGDSGVLGAQKSYFDGSFWGYIGHQILYYLISVFSLGIAVPWAMCMMERWKINHTVINGRRLKFTGTGAQLLGKYLLGVLLCIVTLGIYSIWFGLSIEKWKVSHTVYEDAPNEVASRFTGGAGGWFAYNLLLVVFPLLTFGIGLPFAMVMMLRWKASNTVIGGSPLAFKGSGGGLFGRLLLWGFLSCVTFGIFRLFVDVMYFRWEKENTHALYRTLEYKTFSREQEKRAIENVSAYGFAANNTEFNKLKSGIKGDEGFDEIKAMAENGNVYACYDYACELINKYGEDNKDAMGFMRMSAYGGYHQAMLQYAYYIKSQNEQEFVGLLKSAAKGGNFAATRALKEYYENLAYELKTNNDERCVDALRESAYWFKVAVSQGNYPNEDTTYEYEKMLDTVALWKASMVKPKKGGAGVIVGAILGVIALLGVLAVGAFMVMAVFGLNVKKADITVNEPMPYEEYTEYEDVGGIIEEKGQIFSMEGLYQEQAVEMLNEQGFSFSINYTETTDYVEGTVISSSHPEGFYSKNDTIVLEIAMAPEYPELTEARAFELADRCYEATWFMAYYFGSRGMLDFSDTYDLAVFSDEFTVECGSVPSINTQDDLRNALAADFTDDFIESDFMTVNHNNTSNVTMYDGCWFEANGKIYYMPNHGMGFYGMDIDTLYIEQIEPGKYRVECKGGAPEPQDYGEPHVFTVVYTDGDYKVDDYYVDVY